MTAQAIDILMNAAPDEDVVRLILAGQTSLFEILMRRYNQRLFRVARSILKVDDEAEDVMQDAYVRAYTHLDQFDGRAKFATWLTKIAVHEALARLRNRRRMVEFDALLESGEDVMKLTSKEQSPEQQVMTRTMSMVLESAIDSLADAYRSVFMLRDVEGLSTAETAECLDISEEAVKVRLHRARLMLRKTIAKQAGAATAAAFQFAGARCDRIVSRVMERIKNHL
ncbi:MAG TPA: RNA polymerase sigma factor [Blastocatellia bacterium]|nr:RNA polymerase sigma factor [Blastocatellia bacterium]